MAEFLARRVYEGKLSFEDVPERFKEAVSEILESKYGFTLTDTPMQDDMTAEKDVVQDVIEPAELTVEPKTDEILTEKGEETIDNAQ